MVEMERAPDVGVGSNDAIGKSGMGCEIGQSMRTGCKRFSEGVLKAFSRRSLGRRMLWDWLTEQCSYEDVAIVD